MAKNIFERLAAIEEQLGSHDDHLQMLGVEVGLLHEDGAWSNDEDEAKTNATKTMINPVGQVCRPGHRLKPVAPQPGLL